MNILDTLTKAQKNKTYTKAYKKNAVIFHENDYCDNVGIIIKGNVSIVTYLDNGNEVLFNSLNQDEEFGNNLIFSSHPYYKGNIIATADTTICYIDKKLLINLLQTNKDFLLAYLNIQSNFSKKLNNNIKLLSMDNAKDRLMFYLHINNGTIEYKSVSELAKALYLQRETLSRLIHKLIKDKQIVKDKNTIRKV